MAISISSVTTGTDSGVSASVSVTTSESPAATQVGDLVVVIHANDFYALSQMGTPSATGSPTLTAIGSTDGGSNEGHIKAWWYVVNTGGAQAITVSETAPNDEEKSLTAYVLHGAVTVSPVDGTPASNSSTTGVTSQVCNAVTTVNSDSLAIQALVSGGGAASTGNPSYTPPAGTTKDGEWHPDTFLSGAAGHKQLSASGSTGTFTWTTGGACPYASLTFAIAAAAASGAPSAVAGPYTGPTPGRISPTGQWRPALGSTDPAAAPVAVGLTDTGAGDDGLVPAVAVPLPDAATGSDTFTAAATIALPDAGAGSETLASAATVPLADTGSGADAVAVSVPTPLADAGSGADALVATSATLLADTGGAADALTVSGTVPVTDTGTSTDSMAAGVPIGVSDSGAGGDAFHIAAAGALTDAGTGIDSLAVTATLALTDSGTAADARAVLVTLTLTEAASALDTVAGAAAVALPEVGAGSDAFVAQQLGGPTSVLLTDAGAGRDRIHVICHQPGAAATTRPASGTTRRPDSGITYYQ